MLPKILDSAVLPEKEGTFTIKEDQQMALMAFLIDKDVVTLLLPGFGKN